MEAIPPGYLKNIPPKMRRYGVGTISLSLSHTHTHLIYLLTYLLRTSYMGTDGRWNDANSPIDPWQHRHEGGAERGDRKDHLPA